MYNVGEEIWGKINLTECIPQINQVTMISFIQEFRTLPDKHNNDGFTETLSEFYTIKNCNLNKTIF